MYYIVQPDKPILFERSLLATNKRRIIIIKNRFVLIRIEFVVDTFLFYRNFIQQRLNSLGFRRKTQEIESQTIRRQYNFNICSMDSFCLSIDCKGEKNRREIDLFLDTNQITTIQSMRQGFHDKVSFNIKSDSNIPKKVETPFSPIRSLFPSTQYAFYRIYHRQLRPHTHNKHRTVCFIHHKAIYM